MRKALGSFFYFSKKRYFLYLFFFILFLFLQGFVWQKKRDLRALKNQLEQVIEKAERTRENRLGLFLMKKRLEKASSQFSLKDLSTFALSPEKSTFSFPKEHPLFYKNGKENEQGPFFEEQKKNISPLFLETFYKLGKQIKTDKTGLERLLCFLEKVEIGSFSFEEKSPDYLITYFDLKKQDSCFLLYLELIERSAP